MNKTIRLTVALSLLGFGSSLRADFTISTPTNLGPMVNNGALDFWPNISADGLSLYFVSNRAGGVGDRDLWVTTRPSTRDDWGPAVNLGPNVNSPYRDESPSISSSGLELFFESKRPRGYGEVSIWVATRTTTDDEWEPAVCLAPPVNSPAGEGSSNLSFDGLTLYFWSPRQGGAGLGDLWMTRREAIGEPWGEPANLGPSINSSAADVAPSIFSDELTLFFGSFRVLGGFGYRNILVSTRPTKNDAWGTAVNR